MHKKTNVLIGFITCESSLYFVRHNYVTLLFNFDLYR